MSRITAVLLLLAAMLVTNSSLAAYDEDVIVYTAHQDWLSRIYVLSMDGSVITYFEYDFYYFCDLEVIDNEVYVAEAFAPRVYRVDIETGELETVVDDWSLFYFYDVAFDDTFLYVTEWDLNRYDVTGEKDGTASFDQDTFGAAWDGAHYWTLNDQNQVTCWDLSSWPNVIELPDMSFAPPGENCRGLWYDGEYFWSAESIDGAPGSIYRFDHSGVVVDEWPEPAYRGWAACVIEGDSAEEIIIDDYDDEFFIRGSWSTAVHPDAVGDTLHYSRVGGSDHLAAWRVDTRVPASGLFDVYAWKFDHEFSSRMSPEAPYWILSVTGLAGPVSVDQSTPGNEWVHLGRYEFDTEHLQGVALTASPDGAVIADAVKLIAVTP